MTKVLQRLAMAAVLIGGVTALTTSVAEAKRPVRPVARARRPASRSGFQLFAGGAMSLEVNRVYCGLTDAGNVCTDITGSPVLGGGSWPRGTPDQYIFNTGLQISGIVPANAGFAWAGDTTGAWGISTSGPGEHMQALTGIYNSLDGDDLANWPHAAGAIDPALYDPSLLGRSSISQQDTWVRYWDGSPGLTTGRRHTMGVLVEQRSMAWNFPTGNEDLVYFVFRFINITSKNPASYAGLSALGYDANDIAEIAAIGANFQTQSEAAFNVAIPDDGYTVGEIYANFTADMDVGDATTNYATANLPFQLAVTWKSDWAEASWQFPGNIFSAPFAAAPGFVGVKYLKSPVDPTTGQEFGITIFSTYTNPNNLASLMPDPSDIYRGYRYAKGVQGPATGDKPCQYPPSRHLCFLGQQPDDQRQSQSSGPFSLAPGEASTIVVAYLFAPPAATNPGDPTYDLAPYIGDVQLLPGVVPSGDRLVQGLDTLRVIDRTMGWVSHADANLDGMIDQSEVTVMPGSILDKSLVAQSVFDNRFLLPFSPEAPEFFLVPGNNAVTVVWKKSATETAGDPYYVVASDPTQAVYDPNFRQYDVEGYRIWRGRSSATLELIAQFDYDGALDYILDFNGNFYNADYNDATTGANLCAPELGITSSCPDFIGPPPGHEIHLADGGPAYPGAVQVPFGGRVETAAGTVLITQADTAVSGAASGSFPPLTDTGVPFAFQDNNVRNGYTYYYAVTAFDVNSLKSGPSSLSSPQVTQVIIPRSTSGQEVVGGLAPATFLGADGQPVPLISMPTIDATTGIFSGSMPQAQIDFAFAAFVPEIVTAGSLNLKIDSVVAGSDFAAVTAPVTYYVTLQGAGAPFQMVFPINQDLSSVDEGVLVYPEVGLAVDSLASRYGGDDTYKTYGRLEFNIPGNWRITNWGRGNANSNFTRSILNGPRWWSGSANENTPDPNISNCGTPCVPGTAGGSAVGTNVTRTAGNISGVSVIYHLSSYINQASTPGRALEGVTAGVARAADVSFYWGANGAVDSVIDDTHRVPVPFDTVIRPSWGFINAADFGATQPAGRDANKALLTFADVYCIREVSTYLAAASACVPGAGQSPVKFNRIAALSPIAARSSSFAGTATVLATGNGFILYINGHFFLMQMAALPTAGTVWHLRTYSGTVRHKSTWTGPPASPGYTFIAATRPPAVPGMRIRIDYAGTTVDPSVTTDANMAAIHTVPDPYYVTNNAEITTNEKRLHFVNVPAQAIIRIYSASGILVDIVTHNDPAGSGDAVWGLRNRNQQFVASGVYFYHVESADGRTKVGRFTVVNYSPQ